MTFCSKCGAKNPDDGMFCYKCGAELVREAAVPEAEPVAETVPGPEPIAETVTEPVTVEEGNRNLKAYAWVCIILAYVVGAYFLFFHKFGFTSEIMDISSTYYGLTDLCEYSLVPAFVIYLTIFLFLLTFTGYGGILAGIVGFVVTLVFQHLRVYVDVLWYQDYVSFDPTNLGVSLVLILLYAVLCGAALYLMVNSTAGTKADGKYFSGSIGAFYGFNKE